MTRKIILLLIILLPASEAGNLKAQNDSAFSPNGKPFALIFSDINYKVNTDGNSKAFEITRSYLGYEYNFTRNISAKVNLDVADPGVGKLQMTAYVKNALIQYKKDNFSVRFGMIGTDQYNIQEKQWGYRYIYKSFQDAYGFGPSADLGAALSYSPVKYVTIDLSVLNGEGYKKIQADSTFKTTFGITLNPFKGLVLRGYYDFMNHNYNQQSLALYAGYSFKRVKAGIEYNNQKNNGMLNGRDFSGVSAYSSVGVGNKFTIFARYDNLWSVRLPGQTDPWNNSKDGQLYMVGFDYSPVRGVRISPNYQGWSPSDGTIPFTSSIALNFELKF